MGFNSAFKVLTCFDQQYLADIPSTILLEYGLTVLEPVGMSAILKNDIDTTST